MSNQMKVSQDMPSKENKCECVQKGDNREVFRKKIFIKQNGKINTESNDMGRPALHATFSCQRHDGVDLRKIIAYQPVGSHRLVGVSSRLRSPSHKSCNRAATALDANECPSSLEVLASGWKTLAPSFLPSSSLVCIFTFFFARASTSSGSGSWVTTCCRKEIRRA